MSAPPDIGKILEQAQAMQEKMGELQRQLAMKRYEASSGGGMVEAIVTGQLQVLEIRIEPSLISSGDRPMIQDLTAAAVNAALTKAQQGVQEEIQQLQGSFGINLPGGVG